VKRSGGSRPSGASRSTGTCWRAPSRAPACCTACPRTAARRSRPRSSTAPSPWSSTRRRTACTRRRRSW
jgi:hypothetical protein